MDTYITRLCWNKNGWERPSGLAPKLEKGTFSTECGFGFEEWLFNDAFEVDGWHYGFVQGANKSQRRLAGTEIRILLFSLGPLSQRYFVGELEKCWVLTEQDADAAHARLDKKGVIRQMLVDVAAVGGKPEYIQSKSYREKWTLDIINVRYRREDRIQYIELLKVPESSVVSGYTRYQLISAGAKEIEDWRRNTRAAKSRSRSVPAEIRFPEEVPQGATFHEGSVQQVLVNRYERDPRAREACILHHKPTCVVCGFNFGAVFGSLAEGFIHVHHTKPLSEIGKQYQVDPVNDLRPVCPNCHAVIHLNGGCRDIE